MQQLIQKERQFLQEALKHEEVCVAKYGQYANQLQDPQLKQMFQQLQQKEQQHYQTISNLLGQAGGGGAAKMQQYQVGGGQQQFSGQQHGGGQITEEEILQDMLMTEKYVADSYNMTVLDSLNNQVRQQIQHIQNEEQQHANQIVDAMVQKGYYQLQ
ncbi:MAG: spore coat protein [Clostridia bacterium]|nr:spore coat protein [Clostridia bacterium]